MRVEDAAVDPAGSITSIADGLRVFWMPGCSSCARVKEFLNTLGVRYESVNILTDPKAESDLRDMGASGFPVVSRGREFVCAQSLDDVAKFLGREVGFDRLSPAKLMERWFYFCDIALELVDNVPQQHLHALAIPNRNRTVHDLSYHIFQVPYAFLENAENGEERFDNISTIRPRTTSRPAATSGISANALRIGSVAIGESCRIARSLGR